MNETYVTHDASEDAFDAAMYQHWNFFYELQKFLLILSEPFDYLYPIEGAVAIHRRMIKGYENAPTEA